MRAILKYLYILASCLVLPAAAFAQGPTYTIPQSVQATVATTTACTGIPQTFSTATPALNAIGFRNLGQTQHSITVIQSAGVTNLNAAILGQDNSGNTYQISDALMTSIPTFGFPTRTINGSGSFPNIIIQVTCNGGTFSINYSGTSSTSNVNTGSFLVSTVDKMIFNGVPESSSAGTFTFTTPFGSSGGDLFFGYGTAAISGSVLNVNCDGASFILAAFVFNLANTGNPQIFQVPALPCPILQITYVSGGGGAGTASLDYFFTAPGTPPPPPTYTHITGTTATSVKPGPGTLHSLVVGTSAAGTISLFDLAPAACTGTPATNVVSVITEFASATPPPPAYIFDVLFNNGICVKASAAMDITVGSN